MARHRAPVQALRNFLSILLGFALGAVNNLVILPWAFADNLGEWGLVRIVMAWGSLIASILVFGAPAAMNKYSGVMERSHKTPQLMGTLMWPSLLLFTVCIALPALVFSDGLTDMFGLSSEIEKAVQPIAIISAIITAQLFLAGFLSTKLKTSLATFVQETVFKLGYASLAIALGLGWMSIPAFLPAFLGLQFCVFLLLLAQAMANRFKVDLSGIGPSKLREEIRRYGAALVMGSGAWVILSQLDIIMVGSLMGLDQVPIFTVAAFIAAVTTLPTRASQRILVPLISKALDSKNNFEIDRLIQLSHRSLLLSGGWIVTCIWVASPQIEQLLPVEFRNLSAVILVLGLMKLIQGSTKGSSILLHQSDHFQKVVAVNWSMVAVAIPLNFLFIPESGLGLGLLGAALATLISIGISSLAKQALLWHIYRRFVPNKQTAAICAVLLIPALTLVYWNPGSHPILTLLLKSTLVTAWLAVTAVKLKLVPEGVQFALEKAPWLSRWV